MPPFMKVCIGQKRNGMRVLRRVDKVAWRERSESRGKNWRKQEGVTVGQPAFLCLGNPTPCRPLQGNLAIRAGAGASGLSGPTAVKKPPPGPCPLAGVSARDQLPGAQRQAVPRPAAGEPGVRRGTHNVGAHGAEGRGATGEQVAAVEWQEDLDVVLTVPLEEGGGCQAQASHQGAPPSPPHGTQGQPWG